MKRLIIACICIILSNILACDKDENDTKEKPFNAVVLEKGLDCGNSYLIEFNDNVSGLPENSSGNIFYEINLPESYKVDNNQINVEFRLPENDEFMACTALGIAYPQIYIIRVD